MSAEMMMLAVLAVLVALAVGLVTGSVLWGLAALLATVLVARVARHLVLQRQS